LKFSSEKSDTVSTIVDYGNNLFREFNISHNLQFEPIGCFSRKVAVSSNNCFIFFVSGLTFFELYQGLIRGIDDDNAGIAVYDDDIVVFDCPGALSRP